MTKKKPDFLRDLDTAIMDELTGGGIKGNAAGLVGTLTQIKEIKQLCGLPFCGYMAKLETVRPSGVPDEVTVVFAEDVPYRTGGSCFLPCICWQEQADEAAQWQQGDTVELLGRYQSRQYEKVLDTATGEREQRTAYEVSVRLIRRKEEAENEC